MSRGVLLDGQPDADAYMDALRSPDAALVFLLRLEFRSQTIRLCDWTVPALDGLGEQYDAFGGAGWIEDVEAGLGMEAAFREYVLGVPPEIMSENGSTILSAIRDRSNYVDRPAVLMQQLYLGLDGAGRPAPVGVPVTLHTGRMQKLTSSFQTSGAEVRMQVEGDFARKRVGRFGVLTDQSQRQRHPIDLGAAFAASVPNEQPIWPNY